MKYLFLLLLVTAPLASPAQDHDLYLTLNYPVPLNSFSGALRPGVQYSHRLGEKNWDWFIGWNMNVLRSRENRTFREQNFYVGFGNKIRYRPFTDLYPYLNVGFSGFRYQGISGRGFNPEAGMHICFTSFSHAMGLQLAYSHDFIMTPELRRLTGSFGTVLVGIHFHLFRQG